MKPIFKTFLIPIFLLSIGSCYATGNTSLIEVAPELPGQIFIPAGTVMLGSDEREKAYAYSIGGEGARIGRWFDIEEEREVFVDDFYIDKYPVTQDQYHGFVESTGYRRPFISESDYLRQGFLIHPYSSVKPYLWKRQSKGGPPIPPQDKLDHPVVLVSALDASTFCAWRGRDKPEKNLRLPTEDEWEKAARGSDIRRFPWGNDWDSTRANIWSTGPHGTTPVTKYEHGESPYGASDMAGNVFEWPRTPLKEGSTRNILKSCSWDDLPGICRGAARHSRPKKSRHILIGFRCASSASKRLP
jgi:formylglycine-generating enzyme required for sulfatase activity